jgi:hypothetical protein
MQSCFLEALLPSGMTGNAQGHEVRGIKATMRGSAHGLDVIHHAARITASLA